MKNFKIPFVFSALLAVMIMGAGVFTLNEVHAQAEKPVPVSTILIGEEAAPFRVVADIMEINLGSPPIVVVAEETILVTSYKASKETKTTKLIGSSGDILEVSDLEIGQTVVVEGFGLTNGTIVGIQIEVTSK